MGILRGTRQPALCIKEKGHNGNMEHIIPYGNELGEREEAAACDVLVLGGGLAGCYAAIAAARKRAVLLFWWKRAIQSTSGSAGTGFDHWNQHVPIPVLR